MITIEDVYKKLCASPSDIFEHLPYLKHLAELSETVTEFGTRSGVSTAALLAGKPKSLITYDIDPNSTTKTEEFLKPLAEKTVFKCVTGDTLKINIEPTDFLFIDTWHTYSQLKQELKRNGELVKKFIAFHDTRSFGSRGEDGSYPGLLAAIEEFVSGNSKWSYYYKSTENNGFIVISNSLSF